MVKNLPANAGDTGLIPGQIDPLGKEMATHYSILAREIMWTGGHCRVQFHGVPKSQAQLEGTTKLSCNC